MQFFVYILYSEKFDKHYIGQTDSIHTRIKRHNLGTEKSTKPYRPWILLWNSTKSSRSEALELEKKLKNLSKERLRLFIQKYKSAGPDVAAGKSGC